MRRFLHCLFALMVALVATGAELRPSVRMAMDCQPMADGTCPCGMPMPARGPQPCGTSVPSPVAALVRAPMAVLEVAATAERTVREPQPWPASWTVAYGAGPDRWRSAEPIPVDTGPPLLASERTAHLGVFRI